MPILNIGKPLVDFKPDVHIVIKMQSSNGQTIIESGDGKPINPLLLVSICTGIAKANIDAFIHQQNTVLNTEASRPHNFLALPGEQRCRVPRCGKIAGDLIHKVSEGVQ
jgi:hypothetical protein